MSLAARQRVLAHFLTDPSFESRLRADPRAIAEELEVDPRWCERLAGIATERVRLFRDGRAAKDRRRNPSRTG